MKVGGKSFLETHASSGVLLLGAVVGITSFAYYYLNGLTTAHFDAKAHLVIARRLVDSPSPGYVQMGAQLLEYWSQHYDGRRILIDQGHLAPLADGYSLAVKTENYVIYKVSPERRGNGAAARQLP